MPRTFDDDYMKKLAVKYRLPAGKENVNLDARRSKKSVKSKNDEKTNKGLSVRSGNVKDDEINGKTSTSNISNERIQIRVYSDNNNKNTESSSRTLKKVGKKEIEERSEGRTINKERAAAKREQKKENNFKSRKGLRRIYSLDDNGNRVFSSLQNPLTANKNVIQRSLSCENTSQILPTAESSSASRTKCVSKEVKVRTLTSIEMWKDKMRRSRIYTVRKNLTYRDTPNVSKIKLEDNQVVNFVAASNPESNVKRTNNTRASGNKRIEMYKKELTSKNKVRSYDFLIVQADAHASRSMSAHNHLLKKEPNFNKITPLGNPSLLLPTPTKVRRFTECNKKHERVTWTRQVNLGGIEQILGAKVYLDDIVDVEREKEQNCPKLSSRFLRENVNAEQRKIIVEYFIRLGMHYDYSANVIYQSVRLFDVAIDRILIVTDDIQLVALACLWIILKREEVGYKVPSATKVLEFAKETYKFQEQRLVMYEKRILNALSFNTWFADPFSLFLYYIWKVIETGEYDTNGNDIRSIYICANYLMDVTMLNEQLCNISACVLAMAAAELSLSVICENNARVGRSCLQLWKNQHLCTEWEEREVIFVRRKMIELIIKSQEDETRNVMYKKYQCDIYDKISKLIFDKIKMILFNSI